MKTSMYSPITRPRSSGSTASWTDAFAVAWNARFTKPMAASKGRKTARSGASAAAACESPNTAAEAAMTRGLGWAPAAARSAPAADPIASTMLNRPYVLASPWNAVLAIAVSTIGKLRPNVPSIPTRKIVHATSGRRRTYRAAVRSGREVGRPQPQQADRRAEVAGGVHREHPPRARGHDEQARDGRADQPGRLEHRGVERDRGAEPAGGRDFGHERLPGRRVEREDHPAAEREPVHVGRACRAGDRDDGQRSGRGGVQRLRGQQDAPLRQPVRHRPGVQAEQQHRQELQRHRHAHGRGAAGQAEYQPVLCDALHPRARIGEALAAEVDPVAARAEGGEGASRLPNRLGGSHVRGLPGRRLSLDILGGSRLIWNRNYSSNSYCEML